jgi:transcriptional regulator with XRE-family HTH domain
MTKSIYTNKYRIFREFLIKKRKNCNLTQEELTKKLKKHQSYVSKYESGERRLDIVELYEILVSLDIDIKTFIAELLFLWNNNENR